MSSHQIASQFSEFEDWGTIARVQHPSGADVVLADVSKWQVVVFDLTDPDPLKHLSPVYSLLNVVPGTNNANAAKPGAPTVWQAAVKLDGYWQKGGSGYTFLHFLCNASTNVRANDGFGKSVPPFRPKGGRSYLAEYLFVTTSGILFLRHYVGIESVLSSKVV
jgi:hypothetical protein